jgi:hypothetical protein
MVRGTEQEYTAETQEKQQMTKRWPGGTQQEDTAETQEKQQMIKRWPEGHSRDTG